MNLLILLFIILFPIQSFAMGAPPQQPPPDVPPAPVGVDFEQDLGITVVNQERLGSNTEALREILVAIPSAIYEWLECISVQGPPFCSSPEVNLPGVNIFADGNQTFDDPWPPGFQGKLQNQWAAVVTHEIGHGIERTLVLLRGLGNWQTELIQEAGCEPLNYLRGHIAGPCFFQNTSQEFFASLMNQWFASGRDMLRLAVERFKAGTPHPLNQALYVMRAFSVALGTEADLGAIWAYEHLNGLPQVEVWQVSPWGPGNCDGPVQITGPGFGLGLLLDSNCRAVALLHANGL